MDNNIGDPRQISELFDKLGQLNKGLDVMRDYGYQYANAEYEYKIELKKAVQKMRDEGLPVTLISLEIYGEPSVAALRKKRDTAKFAYEAVKERINVLKLQSRIIEAQVSREWSNV